VALTCVVSVRFFARAAEPNPIAASFSDHLVFVGTADYSDDGVAAHGVGKSALPFPESPVVNKAYIFHTSRTKAKLTHEQILAKLDLHGVTATPSGHLVSLPIGGPLYVIEFTYKGRHGKIFNAIDPNITHENGLLHEWYNEDVVVLYDK